MKAHLLDTPKDYFSPPTVMTECAAKRGCYLNHLNKPIYLFAKYKEELKREFQFDPL